MFTGIVEETGKVLRLNVRDGATIEIKADSVVEDLGIGDSICVSGVCLTVVQVGDGKFTADLSIETLKRSTLGNLSPGSLVNLERALMLGKRLGGHIVLGHVDAVGTIRQHSRMANSFLIGIEVDDELSKYIVPKGSIAVDGISLTVVDCRKGWFSVSAIPHTINVTTLGFSEVGAKVNVEVDMLAKYVFSCVEMMGGEDRLRKALEEGGYI